MRFKSFSEPPADAVATLAVAEDRKTVKKKIVDAVVPDKQQLSLIRSVALLVDPRIWIDPNIFPSDRSTLKALAAMTEDAGQLTTLRFLGSDYVAAFSDDFNVCVFKGVTQIYSGSVGGAYRFAMTCANAALPAIKEACCKNMYQAGVDNQDLAAMLTNFRKDRSWAKSLDKATKICQLSYIDQDKTVNKFAIDGDLLDEIGEFCVHYGSGDDNGNSILALNRVYRDVVSVDPRLRHQGPSKYAVKFCPDSHQYGDIVSDVAYGDQFGMTTGEIHAYTKQLYGFCRDRVVIAKVALMPGYGDVRGFIMTKPRPHNLELIVQLHVEGDLLDDLCRDQATRVVAANQRRNTWVHRQEIPVQLLPTYNSSIELKFLMRTKKDNSRPRIPNVLLRLDRNLVLLGGAKKMNAENWKLFVTRCRNPANPYGDTVVLPAYYRVSPGRFRNLDVVFPDPITSFNAIYSTAKHRGFHPFYDGEWKIKK